MLLLLLQNKCDKQRRLISCNCVCWSSSAAWLQVRIDIYEGESKQATENKLLDTFTLSGIPPLPAGEPRILVRFKVDFDGTLSASAHDRTPGAHGRKRA